MSVLKMMHRNQSALWTKWIGTILQDSTPCLSIRPNPTKRVNGQYWCLSSLQNFSSFLPAGFPKYQVKDTKRISVISCHYSSVKPSGNEDKGFQVYEGRVKGLLKRVKIFSLTTSVIGLAGQPYLWYTVQDMSLFFAAPLFTAVNFFVFANPIMIHYLAKRYVTELFYNPKTETYTANVLSFFARKQSFTYTAKDVIVPEIPGLFAMLTANGRPIFVDHRDFTSIEVYKQMMGFDKPLDLTYVSESSEKRE